mmetsp:Transcript_131461/g.294142  ORF Transcript_131461/g.294142 Transcript_131461/m.294142 type:complete len:409 (-) Transcript_131461:103-1329(-)
MRSSFPIDAVVILAVAVETARAASVLAAASAGNIAAYESFRSKYRRGGDAVDFATRLALFAKRRAEVQAHNARKDSTWIAEVNRFADYTEQERQALFGYDRAGRSVSYSSPSSSFLEAQPAVTLAESIDLRQSLESGSFIRQQDACGSCWAVAAVGALEMQAEIDARGSSSSSSSFLQRKNSSSLLQRKRRTAALKLSFEQLVACVENKQHCGGDGGCKGATAELAFEYARVHGVVEMAGYEHGYESQSPEDNCGEPMQGAAIVKIGGWDRLPTNKLMPLMERVNHGPVVVSVAANGWSMYQSGVFGSCAVDAVVNHAVLLIGYGHDQQSGKDYWLIRNSWGDDWGNQGTIKLERHASDEGEAGYCGIDNNSKEGVGCDGDPLEIPICGMCGVLSDSSFPKSATLITM